MRNIGKRLGAILLSALMVLSLIGVEPKKVSAEAGSNYSYGNFGGGTTEVVIDIGVRFLLVNYDTYKAWKGTDNRSVDLRTTNRSKVKMKNDMSCVREDGLGKYTISNAEYCLIARRGKYWREARNVKQIVQYPKTVHSEKPKEIRDRIVSLCGDLPRVELFARDLCDGWDSIGNEIDGRDIRDVIK